MNTFIDKHVYEKELQKDFSDYLNLSEEELFKKYLPDERFINPKTDFYKFLSVDNLKEAFKRVNKASGWKTATQNAYIDLLYIIEKLREEVLNGTYEVKQNKDFILCENGRYRLIRSLGIEAMILQHSLCMNVLFPRLRKYLIYDSGASIKNKGINFTRKQFEKHIHSFYRKHGRDGYILKIDFRKFFDNIQHDKLIELYKKYLKDEQVIKFIERLIKVYEIDMSYTHDKDIINKVFNILDYQSVLEKEKTGEIIMKKSLGIGAPLSQISGLIFPLRIDNYCKTVKSCKYYGTYMDDRYIIHHDKEFLKQILEEITQIANEYGIHINKNKTQIVKLTHSFSFLKTQYKITETGKLIKNLPTRTISLQRRKMKKLAKFVMNGDMSYGRFVNQYLSWRGNKKEYHVTKTLIEMDKIYKELCNEIIEKEKTTLYELAANNLYKKDNMKLIKEQYLNWKGTERTFKSYEMKEMDILYKATLRYLYNKKVKLFAKHREDNDPIPRDYQANENAVFKIILDKHNSKKFKKFNRSIIL